MRDVLVALLLVVMVVCLLSNIPKVIFATIFALLILLAWIASRKSEIKR